jgi:hypothetical protein
VVVSRAPCGHNKLQSRAVVMCTCWLFCEERRCTRDDPRPSLSRRWTCTSTEWRGAGGRSHSRRWVGHGRTPAPLSPPPSKLSRTLHASFQALESFGAGAAGELTRHMLQTLQAAPCPAYVLEFPPISKATVDTRWASWVTFPFCPEPHNTHRFHITRARLLLFHLRRAAAFSPSSRPCFE